MEFPAPAYSLSLSMRITLLKLFAATSLCLSTIHSHATLWGYKNIPVFQQSTMSKQLGYLK